MLTILNTHTNVFVSLSVHFVPTQAFFGGARIRWLCFGSIYGRLWGTTIHFCQQDQTARDIKWVWSSARSTIGTTADHS